MGSFNRIKIKCYGCNTINTMQSKGGTADNSPHSQWSVPIADAVELMEEEFKCKFCSQINVIGSTAKSFITLFSYPKKEEESNDKDS